MSSHFRWFAASLLLIVWNAPLAADVCWGGGARAARANLERQQLDVPKEHDFEIVRDASITEAELRIPRKLLVAEASPGGNTRTAMVGLSVSAAFVGGGLWCLRFHGPRIPRKKLIVAGVLGVLLVGTLFLGSFVSATPPRGARSSHVYILKQLGEINVHVQYVEQGEAIVLVVPPELADKIAAR